MSEETLTGARIRSLLDDLGCVHISASTIRAK